MNDEIKEKTPLWDNLYATYKPTILGSIMYASHRNVLKRVMNDILCLPKNTRLLDMGCGKGSTLSSFKTWGFTNYVGIDLSDVGLKKCQDEHGFVIGKDVFKMDATDTDYKDQFFDVVFSEGTLEHYVDFSPFIKEMCRISNDYVILIQPNHFSIYGYLIQIGWALMRSNAGGVKELTYPLSDFYKEFKEHGFEHVFSKFTLLRENAVLVFRKQKKCT